MSSFYLLVDSDQKAQLKAGEPQGGQKVFVGGSIDLPDGVYATNSKRFAVIIGRRFRGLFDMFDYWGVLK